MSKRVVIVGGVAGGMSCAARIKRLDDTMQVTVFEKGPDVSFSNCGMPYYIGGMIESRVKLLVQTPERLTARYGLDIRTRHEVTRIDREAKTVTVTNLDSGEALTQPYDVLVLSPGASPIRPPLPGLDGPKVYTLRDLQDMDRIKEETVAGRHAAVVGGGFIGLELAECLHAQGLKVSLVEKMDQVMPAMDGEMVHFLHEELEKHGVALHLGDGIQGVEGGAVLLESGTRIDSDFVCLCIGVRPNTGIVKDAGIDTDERGFIKTDASMRTNDPDVYAVGDAVQVRHFVTGQPTAVPLAGPANRQGRIAADRICGRESGYRDSQGTAIVKVFDLAAGQTGLSEKQAKQAGLSYQRVYLHPTQHSGYYPGAKPIAVKLVFGAGGQIHGVQAVGAEGVEVFIDIVATAMRGRLTVYDLEHLELAYSPQWGAAKHGVNMAGFAASNMLRGDVETVERDTAEGNLLWLDVRNPPELEAGTLPGAVNIPLDSLRERYEELPRDRAIGVYCAAGLRGYVACRFLSQQGFIVKNVSGGYRTWVTMKD